MLVAAAGATAIGRWEAGAVLLVLFSLGHALEGYAMGRARRSIQALGAPARVPPWCAGARERRWRSRSRTWPSVTPSSSAPHTRIPADGFDAAGTSSVDQSPITGESVPADKIPVADRAAALADPGAAGPESRVYAGTVNGSGALDIAVTRLAGATPWPGSSSWSRTPRSAPRRPSGSPNG
ncbi:hypothetical protein ACFVX6_26005 [Streptomyces sp. NPDC058289]|uniref:P-type ATPase n=1 Tax=Streptomyces sp. NPDC058289 TaxID=3346425 RepID=UPI0036E97E1B